MRVLVMTKIFPNAAEPLSAPFNRQQIAALGRRCEVEVLAPHPLVPGGEPVRHAGRRRAGWRTVPRHDRIDGLEVAHPRTPYLPRFGHALSAALYGAALVSAAVRRRRGRFDVLLGIVGLSRRRRGGGAGAGAARADGGQAARLRHGRAVDAPGAAPPAGLGAAARGARRRRQPRARRQAAALGVPRDRIDIVTNGVDGELFHPRDRAAARAELGRARR